MEMDGEILSTILSTLSAATILSTATP